MHLTERRHINQNIKHTDICSYRRFTNIRIAQSIWNVHEGTQHQNQMNFCTYFNMSQSFLHIETDPKDFFLKTQYFGCKFICLWWLLWVTCFTALKCNACRLNPFVVQVFFIMNTENFWGRWGIYNSNVLQL